jgi:hypothetical protein
MVLQKVKEEAAGRTILYTGDYTCSLSDSCDVALFDITPEAPMSNAGDRNVTVTHNTCDINIRFDIPQMDPPIQLQVMLLGFFGMHNRNTVSLHTLFKGHSSLYSSYPVEHSPPLSEPKPASFIKEFHLPMCCYDHRTDGRQSGGFRLLSHLRTSVKTCKIDVTKLAVPDVCFTRCPLNNLADRVNILKCPFAIRHKSQGIRDTGLYILIAAHNLRAEPTKISASIEITSKVESEDYWPNSFLFNKRLTGNGMHSASFK